MKPQSLIAQPQSGKAAMKSHVRRFRVKRIPRDDVQRQPAAQLSGRPQITAAACQRCRQLKRKCSRTPPECTACEQADVECSLAKVLDVPKSTHGTTVTDEMVNSQARVETGNREPGSISSLPSTCKSCGGEIHSVGLDFMRRHPAPNSSVETILNQSHKQPAMPQEDLATHYNSPQQNEPVEKSMVDAYFRDAHRAYPFLDQQQVTTILEAHLDSSTPCPPVQMDILMLVMAIGATSLSRSNTNAMTFDRFLSVDYRRILRSHENQESIESLEALILLVIFSGFDPRRILMRPLLNQTVRLLLRLGLTKRRPSNEVTQSQREKCHRLFWSVYSLDRIEALSRGTPINQALVMQGIPLPSIAVEEFNSTEYSKHVSTLQVVHQLVHLRRLEERVLVQAHLSTTGREITRSREGDTKEAAELLRIDIDDWYSGGCLVTSTGSDEMALHVRISWLTARYYNLLILLYYPSPSNTLAEFVSSSERAYFARKYIQCLAVAYRQEQLPFNLTTLLRLFPVLLLLVDYLASENSAPTHEICETRSLLSFCSELLRRFPPHWDETRQAAMMLDDLGSWEVPCHDGSEKTLPQESWNAQLARSVLERLAGLALSVLGADTAYLPLCNHETSRISSWDDRRNTSSSSRR